MLFSRLQAQGITTMSGGINDDDQQIPIHIESMENSEEEIANQIIYSDAATGKVVRVRDIARVVREYEPRASRIEQNGHPCMLLSMEMTPGNNVIQYGKDVDRVLDEFRANELPDDVSVTRIADKPKVVSLSITSFLRDLLSHYPGNDGALPLALGYRGSHHHSAQYLCLGGYHVYDRCRTEHCDFRGDDSGVGNDR